MTELDALLIFNAIPGLSNLRKRQLIAYYGSAKKILSLPERDLTRDKILSDKNVQNILHFSKDKFLKDEYNLISAHGISLISEMDEEYPDLLQSIDDNPLILYVKGNIPRPLKTIAIVGSRRASLSGRLIAEKFAYALADRDYVIVSGLARGIDTAAHQGTLRAKGKTIAVLGSGLACIYPRENKKLYSAISSTCAVISEYPMRTLPLPYNFPRRNRIISGLSLGVVVVEAAVKSGALITADFALDQGREVFAVPCSIESPTAQGVNNLIKEGAQLVANVEDILDALPQYPVSWLSSKKKISEESGRKDFVQNRIKEEFLDHFSDQEKDIWNHLNDSPVHMDDLVKQCGLTSSLTSAVLLQLELKNKVKQLPGKLFRKI